MYDKIHYKKKKKKLKKKKKNKRDKWETNTNMADSNPDAQVIILSVNRLKNNLNEENFRLNTKARLNYMLCRRHAPEIQRHKCFGI